MWMKKALVISFSLICAFLFAQSSAFAEGWDFYVCDVESAGIVRDTEVLIDLTHNEEGLASEFVSLRFTAKTGREKEMLATALTALSIGGQVMIYSNPDLGTTADRVLVSMFAVKGP